ncbi:Gfo/Idh/MocA family oxidoreductase [Paenibacillus sp. N4]|uniref:Gfo/Idh/MocA family protein n=1 Tax=Paenibacillus vietnamensis TaxID=2590547 RepID=UPI001CD0E38F|nr:Gfo/Idh/MocA family oxidoreductase [Paenibacillus vietnamensis]MCA0755831.1 Gfo/Idh/MocA family oxidoreductase [Paenibacillus vietnamensis]
MSRSDGMNYAPQGKPNPVVAPGEFQFAAIALDHGHVYGMCNGLIEAGGELVYVYDSDPEKVDRFLQRYPHVKAANSEEEIFADPRIQLVASAAITSERCALGLRVMRAGKDYFTDKAPLTTIQQLEDAKRAAAETGRKYMVYYSERLHCEGALFAGQLIEQGAIGRVVQVMGWGPHRLNAKSRPEWFFEREKYGGIICDIGSHQIEQFLSYTGAKDAKVVQSRIANYHNKQFPELEDYGDVMLTGDNGAAAYFRVDWLTPDGLSSWGDGRTLILGTDGYIEVRKNLDLALNPEGDQVYMANQEGEYRFSVKGQVGYPFFGQLILDCIHRTENAMTQEHAFKAAELSVLAQNLAVRME